MGISKKSWTGLVFETTPGTGIVTPTVYHPCKSKFQNKKKFIYLSEDRGSRDGNTKRKASVRAATGDINGTFYLDTSPYLLKGFMGAVTSTQPDAVNAPSTYQHAFALTDVPPALTVLKGYDVAGYYFSYSVVEKLKYSWAADNKLLEESANVQSRYGTPLTSAQFTPLTPTYSLEQTGKGVIFAGYTPSIQLSGTQSNIIEEMDIELDQKITLFYAINGSKDHVKVYFGDRTAKVNFTASFDDTSLYDRFDQEVDDHIAVAFLGQRIANLQTVSIPSGSTAGTFTLSYKGQTTAGIAFNATASAVQTALQALSTVSTNATVTGGPGPASAFVVKFTGTLANDATLLTGTGTGLTPSGAVTVADSSVIETFSMDFPIVGYDDAEMAVDKEYIQIKAKATARPGNTLNSLMTAKVINNVVSYVS